MSILSNIASGLSSWWSGLQQNSNPQPGTSAYKAMTYANRTGLDPTYPLTITSLLGSSGSSGSSGSFGSSGSSGSSGQSGSYGVDLPEAAGASAQSLDYLNAELAQHYGMNASTAYQEALSNTAYQRAVKDMQAAGLNPAVLFGSGRAYPASGITYMSQDQSGSSGYSGSSGRSGAGSSDSGYVFSEGAYGAISAAAGLVGMTLTKNPTGFWIGSQTAKGIMGAINSLAG